MTLNTINSVVEFLLSEPSLFEILVYRLHSLLYSLLLGLELFGSLIWYFHYRLAFACIRKEERITPMFANINMTNRDSSPIR